MEVKASSITEDFAKVVENIKRHKTNDVKYEVEL
jgi:hypothetical protein